MVTGDGYSLAERGGNAQNMPDVHNVILDLGDSTSDDFKKHCVIHQFGHILGLGHEHQYSIFWKCVRPYFDFAKLSLNVSKRCIYDDVSSDYGPMTEYDHDSIMHYRYVIISYILYCILVLCRA